MIVVCSHCASRLIATDELAGRERTCPICHQPLGVPGDSKSQHDAEALRSATTAPSASREGSAIGPHVVIERVDVAQQDKRVELHVHMRNSGTALACLDYLDVAILSSVPTPTAYFPCAPCDVMIGNGAHGVWLACQVEPHEALSFTVTLGSSKGAAGCYFEARLLLRYNDGRTAVSVPFRFNTCWMESEAETRQRRELYADLRGVPMNNVWGGKQRRCPKCSTVFKSVQDLGACPTCRHTFLASAVHGPSGRMD